METLDLVFAELSTFTIGKRKPGFVPRPIHVLGNVGWPEHLMR